MSEDGNGTSSDHDGAEDSEGDVAEIAEISSNREWIERTLWRSAPDTSHLKKRRQRVQIPFPKDLLAAFNDIETVEVLGVPAGAIVDSADETDTGVWRFSGDIPATIPMVPPD
ncbi:MAG: hypothetical protein HOB37_15360, partial [Rhodospirillaceae bacterium]|nr:hypothetical protein [Rhodospirillaceae bacterium]